VVAVDILAEEASGMLAHTFLVEVVASVAVQMIAALFTTRVMGMQLIIELIA
jgi:hypothetical protein